MDLITKRQGASRSRAELMASAARRYLPNCALGLAEPEPESEAPTQTTTIKATPDRRAILDSLVVESNRVTVLGHLHPRHLRKEYGE